MSAARYGSKPGEHEETCDYAAHGWTCNCPYSEAWLEDVESVAQEVLGRAVAYAIDFEGVGWEDFPDLPEFVWEAVAARAKDLGINRWNDHRPAYHRLSALATEDA